MADIRIVPSAGAINVTGSADFRGTGGSTILYLTGSGQIGAGTTNPDSEFHIVGSGTRFVTLDRSGTRSYDLGINSSGTFLVTDNTVSADRIALNHSGSVGIGTTGPLARLHISSEDAGLRVTGTTRSQIFLNNSTAGWQIESSTSTGNVPAGALGIIEAGIGARLSILTGGSVGIGTTNPLSLLHIRGSEPAIRIVDTDDSSTSIIGSTSGYTFIRPFSRDFRVINDAGTGLLTVKTGGSVGIGTINPISKLDVNGDITGRGSFNGYASSTHNLLIDWSAESQVTTLTATNLFFGTNAQRRMTIASDGNIGIGVTNPAYKLEISGKAYASTELQANTAVMNTTSGYASFGSNSGTTAVRVGRDASLNDIIINADGNVGIGITNPSQKFETTGKVKFRSYGSGTNTGTATYTLSVDSSGNVIETANSSLTGTGTANYITKWSGTTALTNSLLYDDGTNVGIGTTGPQKVFEVVTPANNFASVGVAGLGVGQWTGIHFGYRENNQNYRKSAIVFERTDLTANDAQGKIHILNGPQGSANSATLSDARVTIAEGGNVGIGLTNPSYALHINGGAASRSDVQVTYNALGTTNADGAQFGIQSAGAYIWNFENSPIYFGTNNSRKVDITADGNVGIGTASPGYKLHISGGSEYIEGGFGTNTATAYTAANRLIFNNDYSDVARGPNKITLYDSSWLAGFGIHNDTLGYYTGGTHKWYQATSATNAVHLMTLNSSGNLGIGTTDPGAKLDVAGSIYVRSGNELRLYNPAGNDWGVLNFTSTNDLNLNGTTTVKNSGGVNSFYPNTTEVTDLGRSSFQFRDGYLSRNLTVGGDMTVTGKITAREFHTTFVSASIIYQSGSTQFGNSSDDKHIFTGNVGVGSASPAAKIDIVGTNSTLALSFGNTVPNNPLFINTYGGYTGIGMDSATAGVRIVGDTNTLVMDAGYYTNGTPQHANWNSLLKVLTNGNVGIGTTTPATKLQVNGTFASNALWTDGSSIGYWGAYSTAYGGLTWDTGQATVFATGGNKLHLGSNGSSADMTIDLSGNILMGDTISKPAASASPARLTLRKFASGTATTVISGSYYLGVGGNEYTANSYRLIGFGYAENNTQTTYPSYIGYQEISTSGYTYGDLIFGTRATTGATDDPSERMRITYAGNVGIGTTSATNRLTVYQGGGVRVTGIVSGDWIEMSGNLPGYTDNQYPVIKSNGTIHFANNNKYSAFLEGSDTYFGILNSSTVTKVFLATSGNTYFTGGNVGIGLTNPASILNTSGANNGITHDDSTTGKGYIRFRNGGTQLSLFGIAGAWEGSSLQDTMVAAETGLGIRFYTNGSGTAKMVVTSAGNVGISTTSPGSSLTVGASFATIPGITVDTGNTGNSAFVARKTTSKPAFGLLPWDESVFLSAGIYYDGDAWQHHSNDNNNQLFVLDPVTGVRWYASNNGTGSWNVSSNELLWDNSSIWKNLVRSTRAGDSYFTGGNVGIGTTAPSQKLHVQGAGQLFSTIGAGDNVRTGVAHYDTTAQAAGIGGQLVLGYKYTDAGDYTEGAIIKMYKENSVSGEYGSGIKFQVRNHGNNLSTKVVINPSGNVGIGTTDPGYPLHVYLNSNSGLLSTIRNVSTGTAQYVEFKIGQGDSRELRIGSSYNYSSAEWNQNWIYSVDRNLALKTDNGYAIRFYTDGTGDANERMRVASGGNVGIGTTAPRASLDVAGGITIRNTRVSTAEKYPLGHYTPGETVFEIDPTWTEAQLQDYFNSTGVTWTADSTAPGGYAIQIDGAVDVGGAQNSGFPYIPVDSSQDDWFYMECWIRNEAGSTIQHYMGGIDYDQNFSSLGGNPGSYTYNVMLNYNPGTSWTKVYGYWNGFGNSYGGSGTGNTNNWESGTKYFTPQALFNYGFSGGTRRCYISGWKCVRVRATGNRYYSDNVLVGGSVGVGTTSPIQPLTVAAISNANTIALLGRSADNASRIDFYNNAGNSRLYTVALGNSAVEHYADANIPMIFSTNATERMRILSGGNIGVGGQTAPNGYLAFPDDTQTRKIVLWDGSANNNYQFYGLGIESSTFLHSIYDTADRYMWVAGVNSGARSEIMVLQGNGNLGIGITNPSAKFYVNNSGGTGNPFYVDAGNPSGTTTLFEHTGASTPVPFRLTKSGYSGAAGTFGILQLHMNDNTNGNASDLFFTLNDSANNVHEYAGLGTVIRSNTNGGEQGDLLFFTSDGGTARSEKMRIKSDGNVGIGVTNPDRWLTVLRSGAANGTQQQVALFANNATGATSAAIYIGAYTGTDWLIGKNIYGVSSLTNFQIGDQGVASSYLDIVTGGSIGIGTSAPTTKLNVLIGAGGTNGTVGLKIGGPSNYDSLELGIEGDYNGQIRTYGNDLHLYAGHWRTVGSTASEDHAIRFFTSKTSSTNWSTAKMILTADGNVGIGSNSPGWKLDVAGNARIGDNTDQKTHAALQVSAGQGSASTYRDIDLKGSWAGGEGHAITATHGTTSSNIVGQIVFEHNSPGSRIKFGRLYDSGDSGTYPFHMVSAGTDGRLGIGTSSPAYALDVAGTIRATGDVIAYSDARVKENVLTLENSLELVKKLRGVSYNKIGESEKKIGVIAQEVLEVLPEVVSQDSEGTYSVAYGNITAVLIEAIKQQQLQIDELKAEIKQLKG